jgi:hypothetical protein
MLVPAVLLACFPAAGAANGRAANSGSAARALAHLQAFDEGLGNLRVDLTAPLVVVTPAETRARLKGLGTVIDQALASIGRGFPGVSSTLMLQQVKKIDGALALASKSQGSAQVRDLASLAVAEARLEAAVAVAAAAPSGAEPLSMTRGTTNFGTQTTGSLTAGAARFVNASQSPVTISSAQIATGAFSLARDGCSDQTLAPLAACTMTLAFQPTAVGPATGVLELKDDATSMPAQSYPLSGVGAASGDADVVVKTGASPTPLAAATPVLFPEQAADAIYATAGDRLQAIELLNIGTTSATFDDVTLTGPDAREFVLTPGRGTHGCSDATLAPGSLQGTSLASECYVSVEVRPGRYVRQLDASLVVTGSHTGGVLPIKLALTDADLAVVRVRAPVHAKAGGQLSATFALGNAGPDPADNVSLDARVTADAGSLRLVSSLPQGCAYDGQTDVLACPVGTLPAHSQTTLTAVFQVPRGAKRITNDATVQSLDFDPASANDAKIVVTTVSSR